MTAKTVQSVDDDDYQQQWDDDSDDEEEDDYQPPNRDVPTTPGEAQADTANDAEITGVTERSPIKAPGKATKLTRVGVRRSQRLASKKSLMQEYHLTTELETEHNIPTQMLTLEGKDNVETYSDDLAQVMAHFITEINYRATAMSHHKAKVFAQQHLLPKGLKIFGDRAREAAYKEMDQLHGRAVFRPEHVSNLSKSEISKAQGSLMFITEKRDGKIKARTVYNGKPTREWMSKEDTRSPTVSLEGLMLTMCVDAKEGRDIMTADVPNAFVQTDMPETDPGDDRVIMKVQGILAEMLVEISPETYSEYLITENGKPTLYLIVLKAIYGQLVCSLLWYLHFRKDLESVGFVFNPYDMCVCNRLIEGSQQTVRFHVDDLMSSHILSRINDEFLQWLNDKYGSYGLVQATRGAIHDYLGMTIDFSLDGAVKIDMIDYLAKTCDEFPERLEHMKSVPSAAPVDLFAAGDTSDTNMLSKGDSDTFHTFVAKILFACKRSRPDMGTATAVLCTRVQGPNKDDWTKLCQAMKFILQTLTDPLILTIEDLKLVKWWIDAAFAVHPDFRSHTGAVMSFGRGALISISSKQKLNTRSSTDAELVAVDDAMSLVLWTRLFLEAQGIEVEENIVYQDNKSAIILEEKGKASSGKRTRHLNIRFFFVYDHVKKGNLRIVYCPTKDMRGDYPTKPLQGFDFWSHRAFLMGHDFLVSDQPKP